MPIKEKLRLNSEQVFIICFLAIFICSGLFLLFRMELFADRCAIVSFGFLLLLLIYKFFRFIVDILLK